MVGVEMMLQIKFLSLQKATVNYIRKGYRWLYSEGPISVGSYRMTSFWKKSDHMKEILKQSKRKSISTEVEARC